jgi:carboxymethylenebutenolidase
MQQQEIDQRVFDLYDEYCHGVTYQMHSYPGTRHGFHNNSTPRSNEAAAKLARERTVAFFRRHLG